jgi:hypothetical protein
LTVRIADVALFETNTVQTSPAVAGLALVTTITAAVTLACIIHPKSCFGSCPTFYVSDGTHEVLAAEGFSDSVTPSLEATDVDALWRARPASRTFSVRMTNEALETHVVRSVRVLAAPRPPGGRTIASQQGELWQALRLHAPARCHAAEGDCLEKVRAFDGNERVSTTDAEDLAAREVLELEFPKAPAARVGLVIGARQTLLSTYLFYQLLAYLGRQAGESIAAFERQGSSLRERALGLGRALGGIEVLVEDAQGQWRVVGEVSETGPLAADVKVVPLPSGAGGRVRLRVTRGHYRLDYLALAELGGRVQPISLEPALARWTRATLPSPAAISPFVTLPGDEVLFRFELPRNPEAYELFLESRGYYLEWMRTEWLPEENPARALLMLLDPSAALRLLAPEFKEHEPRMEELFWRSRYAR